MTDKLKELRRLVRAWRDRKAQVRVSVEVDRPEGTTSAMAEADVGAAFKMIDALVANSDALIEVAEAARAVRKHLPMTDYTDNQRKNIAVISDTIALDAALRKLEGQDDG